MEEKYRIPLFYPYVNDDMRNEVMDTLHSRWIGQGVKVDQFEQAFAKKFNQQYVLAFNSGSSALETAYELAGIQFGDEVITTPYTCLYGEEQIQCENGKYISIRKLVQEKYKDKVLSYNQFTKEIEFKKVIGWYKFLKKGNDWIKISHQKARNSVQWKEGVWLTGDHKVFTIQGWKRADELNKNDKLILAEPSLNDKQKELFDGMMLGDGYLKLSNNKNALCRLECVHTFSQKEWLLIKEKAFNGFKTTIYNKKKYKQSKKAMGFYIHSNISIHGQNKRWLKNGKKIIPKDLKLTPLVIATWYLDDGNLYYKKGVYRILICTDCFNFKEICFLIKQLKQLNIDASYQKNGREKWRIYIGKKNEVDKFCGIIAPFVPPSMEYKLPVHLKNKFNKKMWDLGIANRFTDKVYIHKGKPKNLSKRLKYVYCIEVEDNNNFVSKSIILHNCTATNIPLLRMGAHLVFSDIRKDTFNIDYGDVERRITEKTKAIVNVHMGGIESVIPREMEVGLKERGIKVISDACQALGVFNGDYVCNSFQAIKSITTGDGGMLTVYDPEEYRVAKLKRWFGIDRVKKRAEGWQAYKEREMTFDIFLLGYKRQMTDIAAGMGLAGLRVYDEVLRHRKAIFERYKNNLKEINGITLIDGDVNKYWLVTVLVEKRDEFAKMCKFYDIETNMVHIRNDAYKIFGGRRHDLPNMDWVESRYTCLPINMKVSLEDVDYICDCIKKGW